MYTRKIVFTGFTVPFMGKTHFKKLTETLVFVHQSAEYQKRKRDDKEHEEARRLKSLKLAPVNITPKNQGAFPWTGKDIDSFENEWSYKPVELQGYYDHTREIRVETIYKGEKGVQIITPFYTHLDGNNKPNAIFVNRGWVPYDLKDLKHHYSSPGETVRGILYRGEPENKYS